ncbi:MAG: glycosyltransferase family 4 protein [candidate division WOR-3 bacterium]
MKILIGSFSSIKILGGGVDIQIASTARVLKTKNIEIELFSPWKKYNLADYDLFHLFAAHNGTYHLGRSIKMLGAKLVLTPVFYSAHHNLRLRLNTLVSGILRKMGGVWTEIQFCRELCQMADLILVNTEAEKTLITQGLQIDAAKTARVPNGVDKSFFYASPERFVQEFGIKDFVLYVGHIGLGRKNLLPLLKILDKKGIPSVIIGPILNNQYARRCLEVIERSRSIKLLSGVEHDSEILKSAYAACDTFILPSLFETPGLAALEAGIAGAKVCITRYGGTKEYFGGYATYLNPYSPASIEKALEKSLNMPKTHALRDHIYNNYTLERCGEELIKHYKKILYNQG